jgi:ComF family protein
VSAEALWELFFPPSCLACAQVLEGPAPFCEGCALAVEPLGEPRCPRCSEPGPFEAPGCARCRARPPPFAVAVAPFTHEGPVARAIHRYKYEDHPELARPLAGLLAKSAADFLGSAPGEVCAVPLHRRRFLERKYDQAELLAKELARATGRTYLPELLTRTVDTRRQVGLSEGDREVNVAGAFRGEPAAAGRELLLIDDVFTTGATARAAALALVRAGARSVVVLCMARALGG